MTGQRIANIQVCAVICTILLLAQVVLSQNAPPIPADKAQLNAWFDAAIKPAAARAGTLDPALAEAEVAPVKVIKVSKSGGEFDTLTKAVDSIPAGNKKRVIISIAPGTYKEKVKIERTKPFITLLGDAANMPTITFDGTAKQFGTVYSATVSVESDYFVAANIIFENSAPKPGGQTIMGEQAVAYRSLGDKHAFYNCKFNGYQDTLCDDLGNHFYKDCHVRGTVDFIFGNGKSLYLNADLFVEPNNGIAVITAQARDSPKENVGYSFVHCKVSGPEKNSTYLGRAWKNSPNVVFAYSEMSNVVKLEGWSDHDKPERQKSSEYGEFKCTGEGAFPQNRVPYSKQLTEEEAKPYLSLDFIQAAKWLLPPPKI